MKSTFTKLAMAAMTFLGAASLMAQVDSGHGVARVSLIHGDVSTQRGDSGDTAAAALNAPIVTGDKISTGDNSRAEVQLDFANVLRLSGHSQANIASLTDKEIQIQVSQGEATYTAFKTSEIRPEVDAANLSVRPAKGDVSFRIEAISPSETEVTVRKGEAEVSTSSGSTNVRKGEMIVVRGTGADAQYKVEDARDRDDWDKWNDDRDHLISNAEGVHRTSPYYTGSQDLDAYGHWTEMPDYGSVWVPAVSADWVPYRDGRWVWEPYYGWTWVSYEPWGWAPYHYGRWFYSGASWAWWPGPVGGYGYGRGFYRPIWAPAYVSFFGFGGGIGVGVGFGSFGWLPIGPCDSFRPWYGGRFGGRFNQVNITNINFNNRGEGFRGERPLYQGRGRQFSNLRLAETDPHIRGAISAVPAEHFGSGRVAARGIDAGSFRDAKLMTGNLPVVPTRESLNASNRAASPGTFRGTQSQRFFGTNRTASSPQSFDRQAAQVQQSIQRDGHFTPVRSGEPAGGRNPAAAAGPTNALNRGSGNREAGNSPVRDSAPERGASTSRETQANQPGRGSEARPAASEQQGWHRFSGPGAGSPADRGSSDTRSDTRNAPMNRGTASQPESTSRGTSSGGGWQRFPSSNNRGSAPSPRGNPGASEPVRGGSGGWDRGPRPDSTRETGPSYRGPASSGGYERARPTLDMRQPVVTPRSASPSYGGRTEAPRPSGGGGRTEAPRPSGGGGHESRPSGGGGGGHSGGRSSSGGHHG
jgi:FecR protein